MVSVITAKDVLEISLKQGPLGKPAHFNPSTVTHGWEAANLTTHDLITHIESGRPFAVGIYRHNHRSQENLMASALVALDIDKNADRPLTQDDYLTLLQASFIHPDTASIFSSFLCFSRRKGIENTPAPHGHPPAKSAHITVPVGARHRAFCPLVGKQLEYLFYYCRTKKRALYSITIVFRLSCRVGGDARAINTGLGQRGQLVPIENQPHELIDRPEKTVKFNATSDLITSCGARKGVNF